MDGAIGEALDADLRPLQVTEHGDFATEFRGGGACGRGAGAMIVRLAVREIQTDDIDALGQQVLQHARRIGGRAQRGNDAGATQLLRHPSTPVRQRPKLSQLLDR